MLFVFGSNVTGLTRCLLAENAVAYNDERIVQEIFRLERIIARNPDDEIHAAAFRALMWARSPDAHAPVSEPERKYGDER